MFFFQHKNEKRENFDCLFEPLRNLVEKTLPDVLPNFSVETTIFGSTLEKIRFSLIFLDFFLKKNGLVEKFVEKSNFLIETHSIPAETRRILTDLMNFVARPFEENFSTLFFLSSAGKKFSLDFLVSF